jgi:hypothetical protein
MGSVNSFQQTNDVIADQSLLLRWLISCILLLVILTDEQDAPLWEFDSGGLYIVSSFYDIVN